MRRARQADFTALARLMYAAIHATPSPYTAAERMAWLPAPYFGPAWDARLVTQYVLLEDGPDGPLGFASLAADGYIDLTFLHPDARGTGLFRRLIEGLEAEARRQGLGSLTTHASLAAEGPFSALGFAVTGREIVLRDGQSLKRCRMAKPLTPEPRSPAA